MVAIVIGVIFFDIGNDQSTINDRDGLLILCLINNAFNEVFAVLGTCTFSVVPRASAVRDWCLLCRASPHPAFF